MSDNSIRRSKANFYAIITMESMFKIFRKKNQRKRKTFEGLNIFEMATSNNEQNLKNAISRQSNQRITKKVEYLSPATNYLKPNNAIKLAPCSSIDITIRIWKYKNKLSETCVELYQYQKIQLGYDIFLENNAHSVRLINSSSFPIFVHQRDEVKRMSPMCFDEFKLFDFAFSLKKGFGKNYERNSVFECEKWYEVLV